METILNNLGLFNRKERFFLVGLALGNQHFSLSQEFRRKLDATFSLNVPENAFAAMDYHLDWIYASLYLYSKGDRIYKNLDGHIKATQEDIDFLVAYYDGTVCHIVMLEAKGVTGWTNGQLNSKAKRLKGIFGEYGNEWPGVIPHFAIISPIEPKRLNHQEWPVWMKPNNSVPWIKLPIPKNLRSITRCDESGKRSSQGNSWKAEQIQSASFPDEQER